MDGSGIDRLALKFNISSYPTKFILDPAGKILYRFAGSGDEAFELLDDLLSD